MAYQLLIHSLMDKNNGLICFSLSYYITDILKSDNFLPTYKTNDRHVSHYIISNFTFSILLFRHMCGRNILLSGYILYIYFVLEA